MDFDTNFNAETVKHYRASLPAVVSPDLLRRNMDFVLTDVGEYMEEWRRYIVLECWTRLENPHEHRGIVRDWLRVLSSSAPYQMLWTWRSLRDELSKEQQWLLLESVIVGNWSNIVRVEDLPDNEVARLRMMWWQHHFWAIDILPALLSQRERPWAIGPFSNGDSYGVLQSIHLEESLRWVPASSEMHALPLRAWHG